MRALLRAVLPVLLVFAVLSPMAIAQGNVPTGVPQHAEKATVTGYVDGEMFKVSRNKHGEVVLVAGTDAPERGECFSTNSADRIKALLPKKTTVYLERSGEDRDGNDRLIRYVWVAPEHGKAYLLNTKLVRDGNATYDATTQGEKYSENLQTAEQSATARGAGLWNACGGNHVAPTPTPTPVPPPAPTATPDTSTFIGGDGCTYRNVDGVQVSCPVYSDTQPAGATAKCNDGTWSFSLHHQGTCSHHGGVAYFL